MSPGAGVSDGAGRGAWAVDAAGPPRVTRPARGGAADSRARGSALAAGTPQGALARRFPN